MQITVKDLAKELKISIKELGSYLKDLGLPGKGSDILSSEDAQAVKEIIEKANAPIQIPQTISVRDLAEKIAVSANEIQKTLCPLTASFSPIGHPTSKIEANKRYTQDIVNFPLQHSLKARHNYQRSLLFPLSNI